MNHTYTQHTITELKSSGFDVVKCAVEKEWQLKDKAQILMRSLSLGELSRKASKEFGLGWK